MSIKSELSKFKETDIWSLLLFVLYKVKGTPEFSSLSELAFVLDKKNLLKLCEYFGGCTITIPTVDELESLILGLLMYQCIDIENMEFNDAVKKLSTMSIADIRKAKRAYRGIKDVLTDYEITSRTKEDA